MPMNPENKRIPVVLTPQQYEALEAYAKSQGNGLAEAIRQLLIEHVPDFPGDLTPRGKYERK